MHPSPKAELEWQSRAACLQTMSVADRLFFPLGRPPQAVRDLCRQCPVQGECLAYALGSEVEGIWGGLTDRERRELRNAHAS